VLFLDARTPMLFSLEGQYDDLVVARIDPAVMDLPNVVLADGNARATRTRFHECPYGLDVLNEAVVFATWWTDPDPAIRDEGARVRAAEILVPDVVKPEFIMGFYAWSETVRGRVMPLVAPLPVQIHPYLFFRTTVRVPVR
jgi:ssDNA thymidine ADP-ribosyltransferase, DarT